MEHENLSNEAKPPQLRKGAVMQRLIIHSIIVLACYYICHVLLVDDGLLDIVYAIGWSGNAFWFPNYTKWVANVANPPICEQPLKHKTITPQ